MNNIISILSLIFVFFLIVVKADDTSSKNIAKSQELSWVDKQIQAILPERKGISDSFIDTIHQPFIFTLVKSDKSSTVSAGVLHIYKKTRHSYLKATLIINSKALINGRWYNLNDKVHGYKITSIGNDKIALLKNGKIRILSINKDNKNIKINTK